MSDVPLKNYREVGSFDLLSPPLTPIGLVDGQILGTHIKQLVESGSRHVVLDCSGLEFLYSDTLTILAQAHQVLELHEGTLGLMTSSASIVDVVDKSALADLLTIYPVETDLIQASMMLMSGHKPPVQARDDQHVHDLEVVEVQANEGFQEIISTKKQSPNNQRENFPEKPEDKAQENQDSSKPLELKPVKPRRLDQTSEIQIISVEEEQIINPKEISSKMQEAPQGVRLEGMTNTSTPSYPSSKTSSKKSLVIWTIVFGLVIGLGYGLWWFGVIKL